MRIKITEYTWIHTSIFALATAFVATACDEASMAEEEEDLAVEAIEEDTPEGVQGEAQGDELTIPEESQDASVEERRRRNDDDDWGRRRHRRHRDDDHHRRWRDDDHHRRHRDDDGWRH